MIDTIINDRKRKKNGLIERGRVCVGRREVIRRLRADHEDIPFDVILYNMTLLLYYYYTDTATEL